MQNTKQHKNTCNKQKFKRKQNRNVKNVIQSHQLKSFVHTGYLTHTHIQTYAFILLHQPIVARTPSPTHQCTMQCLWQRLCEQYNRDKKQQQMHARQYKMNTNTCIRLDGEKIYKNNTNACK